MAKYKNILNSISVHSPKHSKTAFKPLQICICGLPLPINIEPPPLSSPPFTRPPTAASITS